MRSEVTETGKSWECVMKNQLYSKNREITGYFSHYLGIPVLLYIHAHVYPKC